jgi:hypothetical protein
VHCAKLSFPVRSRLEQSGVNPATRTAQLWWPVFDLPCPISHPIQRSAVRSSFVFSRCFVGWVQGIDFPYYFLLDGVPPAVGFLLCLISHGLTLSSFPDEEQRPTACACHSLSCFSILFLSTWCVDCCRNSSRFSSWVTGSKDLRFRGSNHSPAVVSWTRPPAVRWNDYDDINCFWSNFYHRSRSLSC